MVRKCICSITLAKITYCEEAGLLFRNKEIIAESGQILLGDLMQASFFAHISKDMSAQELAREDKVCDKFFAAVSRRGFRIDGNTIVLG